MLRSLIANPRSINALSSIQRMGKPKAGTTRKNLIGIELVYIPPGGFMMGSTDAEIDAVLNECNTRDGNCKREWYSREQPKHKVIISQGFWMGKYEITQGQWQAVMDNNPSLFKDCGANCPVASISWDDIQIFLKRLNAKNDGFEYSLPSEAQWEYAARAGTTTAFAFGDSLNLSQANYNTGLVNKIKPVGSYMPNAWGLYDMHGNVWEWVEDIYNSSYQNLPVDGTANVSVGDSSTRVERGGGFQNPTSACRSAFRSWYSSTDRFGDRGFRVAARPR